MKASSDLATAIIHAFDESKELPSFPVRSGAVTYYGPQKWVLAIVGPQEQKLSQVQNYL